MRAYFYELDGVENGPITYAELIRLRIPRDSKVWYQGLGMWVRADKLPALKEVPLSSARNSVGISTGQASSFNILDADFDIDGKPKNYRVFSIVAVVLSLITCGIFSAPIAITALVFSFLVDSKYREGFFLTSENFSKYAKYMLLAVGCLLILSMGLSALSLVF